MLGQTDKLLSSVATIVRGPNGVHASTPAIYPEKPLELYEFEGCPYCRLVREALTELNLDAMIYPCPKNGGRYRPKAKEIGGKSQFPLLIDPNTGTRLYESEAIIDYLFKTYGEKEVPTTWQVHNLQVASSMVASLLRWGKGVEARPSKEAKEPLELWSFEASPFSRLVRETLCELELPYLLHNVGKLTPEDYLLPGVRSKVIDYLPVTGANRRKLFSTAGKVQVPYLYDPNTKVGMFESTDIKNYLIETYGV